MNKIFDWMVHRYFVFNSYYKIQIQHVWDENKNYTCQTDRISIYRDGKKMQVLMKCSKTLFPGWSPPSPIFKDSFFCLFVKWSLFIKDNNVLEIFKNCKSRMMLNGQFSCDENIRNYCGISDEKKTLKKPYFAKITEFNLLLSCH